MRQAKVSVRYEPAASGRKTAGLVLPDNRANQSRRVSAAQISTKERPWQRRRVPNGFWDIRENRIQYLEWLGCQLGFSAAEDWYGLRKQHFQMHGGGGLFRNIYRSSALKAMLDYKPEYDWKPWRFGGAPNGFWRDPENRRQYMNWLADQLSIQCPEDWYSVTGADFLNNHGGGLLNNHFKASVQALLADYMPDFPWKPWRFASVPQSYWRSESHRRDYLSWLGDQLGFRNSADWNRLKREHFYKHGGSGLFVSYYHGSTRQAVRELFSADQKQFS